METALKRLYVGGLSPLVTKTELANRFGKFGKIEDVDIICRKDEQGNPIKTFAYLNINISDVDLKKCMSILNKTKWKGGILQIEMAKESFLHRLSQERQEAKEKEKANTWCSQNDLVLPLAKITVPGTVPNHKNLVVSKFGRVLPVLRFSGKKHSKVMKYDPSKYCHNLKTIEDTFELVPVSQLTWQLQGGDDEISRKRRGEFPNLMPSVKRKKKLINLPISGSNDTRRDQKFPFGSMQIMKWQSDTEMPLHNKKHGHLQNKSINHMTDGSNSKNEIKAIFKRGQANANFADDCNIAVVDDSFNLRYITHWRQQKAAPKISSTCNTVDDSEYDSANTDEIITVAKTVQKRSDHFKTKAETVKRDAIKIQGCEESFYACGTKDKCKSSNTEMSKLESESESGASEDDSNCYSDEEYKAMMQNCFKLDLTMRDLETLAKEANEFDNNEKTAYDKNINAKDINAKVNTRDPGPNHVKQKKDLESKDIVASILEDEDSDQQSIDRRKKEAPVKPPAFKGLDSVLVSAAIVNSLSSSSTMSIKTSTVSKISNVLSLSSYSRKQTKKAEKQPSKDFKHIFLKAELKSRSSSRDDSKSDIGLAAENEVEPNISQVDATKEQTTPEVKQQRDNQKRLVAIMERRKERELQKQVIQGALLHPDSQCSKKSQRAVFSSESASEKEDDASTSEKKSMHVDNTIKQSTSKLFSSSEEDSDNEDKEVNEGFEIKAHYEGRSGIKLMELQSSFGKDERFKMDSRFLESSSEDDEASDAYKSHVDEEYDLSAEKKKNLDILQSILNVNMESQPATKQTTKGKKFKDLNVLHYDPAKEDHATLATQAEETKESKYEKTKKRLETEKLPDVSKETFHEIIIDLKEVFGTLKTQNRKEPDATWDQEVEQEKKANKSNESFSFQNTEKPVGFTFSFFGNTTEGRTSNNDPYKVEPIKPAKVAWQEDPRFRDSSEGEDDESDAAWAAESKTRIRADKGTIRFFFFVKDDERLKTCPPVFFRSSNMKQEEEAWEQKKDILLEECRKRHKDAKRKIKGIKLKTAQHHNLACGMTASF